MYYDYLFSLFGGEIEVVCDEQYGCFQFVCYLVDLVEDGLLYCDVEGICGFVGDQQVWFVCQIDCDECMLMYVVGEFVWVLFCLLFWIGEVGSVECFDYFCLDVLFGGEVVGEQGFCDLGVDFCDWVQV